MTGLTHTEVGAQPAAEGFVLRSGSPATGAPDASIVIVTRNRAVEVQRAVRSALDQGPAFETIVIDDCSDDETVGVIARDFPAGMSDKGLLRGLRIRGLGRVTRGLAIGFAHSVRYRQLRKPVANDAYRLGRRLYVRKAVPLSEIEPQLVRFRELSATGSG